MATGLFLRLLGEAFQKLTSYLAALDRLSQIGGQLTGNPTAGGKEKILEKRPDDVSLQYT